MGLQMKTGREKTLHVQQKFRGNFLFTPVDTGIMEWKKIVGEK